MHRGALRSAPLFALCTSSGLAFAGVGGSRRAMKLLQRVPRGGGARHSSATAQDFINDVNSEYEALHKSFEHQFWGTKMALASDAYSTDELLRTKVKMEEFLASEDKLASTRELLGEEELTEAQRTTLRLFERTFGCYIMESSEARALRGEATALEGKLEQARNDLALGTVDPETGALVEEMSSVGLRNTMRVAEEESDRRSCYTGLLAIPKFVVENGFVELVACRNKMAKELGYEDYYDYKVTQAEGFGKAALFDILDVLERDTRPLMEAARARLAAEKGGEVDPLQPWNTGFLMAGDVTKKMDPFFPFEKSVERWGRSFAKLGIGYRGATMDLDLLDRKRKYSNGFCHWPQPAWVKPDGSWQPSVAHFTSLADPGAVGSGLTGLTTLMHEAGHAAHFANIAMPSPLFSQERAPTSVPYAELQSMFLDSLVGDAAWRRRYAKDRDGAPMPFALVEEGLRSTKPFEVFNLRSMLAVPYFEKALYELPEDQLTAERVLSLADEVEKEIQGGPSARPLLTVPHLLSDEASCYYHGYVLAEMAVHQTRAYFEKRDGYIVDNPSVGPTLAEHMWAPGNSEAFLGLVERLTGAPLAGTAWVEELKQDIDAAVAAERAAYDQAAAAEEEEGGREGEEGNVDLDMRVRIVDGDEVIADTAEAGGFLGACRKFEEFIEERYR